MSVIILYSNVLKTYQVFNIREGFEKKLLFDSGSYEIAMNYVKKHKYKLVNYKDLKK